jgi:hypothetical protein
MGFTRGEAGRFIAERNTDSGGRLPPLNTQWRRPLLHAFRLCGTCALRETVRQIRGTAPAQIPSVRISDCHGVGGMFAASGTIIMSNEAP